MITSAQNKTIQWIRRLQTQKKEREASKSYVIEGVRLAESVFDAGEPLQLIVFAMPATDRIQAFLQRTAAAGIEQIEVSDSVMRSSSDTETPQGVLAVVNMNPLPLPATADFILILDAIHDPGNLGTMIRTAKAAGVDALLLAPGCADPSSPKVIRSAMGAHCGSPIIQMDWGQIRQFCGKNPELRIFTAEMEGGKSLWQHNLTSQVALIIGSEAQGISAEAESLAHDKIFIPMAVGIESLNAAVAAGILMFEVARQRTG